MDTHTHTHNSITTDGAYAEPYPSLQAQTQGCLNHIFVPTSCEAPPPDTPHSSGDVIGAALCPGQSCGGSTDPCQVRHQPWYRGLTGQLLTGLFPQEPRRTLRKTTLILPWPSYQLSQGQHPQQHRHKHRYDLTSPLRPHMHPQPSV